MVLCISITNLFQYDEITTFPGEKHKNNALVDKNVHIEIQDYKNVNKRQQRTYLLHRKKIISME